MPVQLENNEIVVTPEYHQMYLRHHLPKYLREQFYNNSDIPNLSSFYSTGKMSRYNKGIEDLNRNSDEYKNKIEDYVQKASKRLYNIYIQADSPLIFKQGIGNRSHTFAIPKINPMFNIQDTVDFIEELSHPIQSKYGSNKRNILSQFKRVFSKKYDSQIYDDPTNFEYETHSIFTPAINDYIYSGVIPEWLK